MDGYEIEKIDEGLWAIDDKMGCSMYLVEGKNKALLVDTGVQEGKILPMLKSLTDKPISLALTHAHIDHMYHADEFEEVYLHERDIKAWHGGVGLCMLLGPAMFRVKHKKYRIKKYIPLTDKTIIDLGGVKIKVINAFGHTPGSVVFLDEKHKALFAGDAVGSGSGAWLWLPGSYNTSLYRDSLIELSKSLEHYNGYRFLPGHRKQGTEREDMRVMVDDMIHLSQYMLQGKAESENSQRIGPFVVDTYSYGNAVMMQRKSKIK